MDSNGKKKNGEEESLPGYPHYPSEEDILSGNSGMTREDADIEALPRSNNPGRESIQTLPPDENRLNDPVEGIQPGPNDLTKDDLIALGDDNLSHDGGDDEQLQMRTHPVDLSGSDLDIPGNELDDQNEDLGSEDEENNLYSLGGDNHDQ